MKAVGFLAGVGSLLREAQDHGLDVLGNVEVRPYFKSTRWIWDSNFQVPTYFNLAELEENDDQWHDVDIVLGHPPCGSYSVLGKGGAKVENFNSDQERVDWHQARNQRKGLIPLFIQLVNKYQPKIFALDNLKAMLKAFSPDSWEEVLPGYSITFIEMVNYDYGSSQRRARLWVVGSRSKRRFNLVPPKTRLEGPRNVWEAIQDLPMEPWKDIPEIAHIHHVPASYPMGTFWGRDLNGDRVPTRPMIPVAMAFMGLPPGHLWSYENNEGRFTKKPAHTRMFHERLARTPSGHETLRHPFTGWPLTVRERARIMGWPDDFKLWDGKIKLDRLKLLNIVKVTGRAVPSEFPRYLIPQLIRHVRRTK